LKIALSPLHLSPYLTRTYHTKIYIYLSALLSAVGINIIMTLDLMYYLGTVVAAGPVVRRLPFLWVVATTPLPVAGEHHRDVGVLYSHSATTDNAPALISCEPMSRPPGVSILYFRLQRTRSTTCATRCLKRIKPTYPLWHLPGLPIIILILILYDTKINIRKKNVSCYYYLKVSPTI